MSRFITGIAASNGIAMAKAFHLQSPQLLIEKKMIEDVSEEIARFHQAIDTSKKDLTKIREHALAKLGADKAAIFDAHREILSDPELISQVEDKIRLEKVNAEFSIAEIGKIFISIFESMEDEYMRERAADIRDVIKRIHAHLLGVNLPDLTLISEEVIIVAEDLTPSDTAQLNRTYVKAFTTNIGGRTSHSAIMARSLEIPAVVGTINVTKEIQHNDFIIVDGLDGRVIIDPTEEEKHTYMQKQTAFEVQQAEWQTLQYEKTMTSDGHHVELSANIGTPEDVESVLANGGEGIGLYRTEFLYMGREQFPTEEEQFEAYKIVLEKMAGKRVIVRTLDIGGDKELSYLPLPKEMNPFLGHRAIRLCLEMPEMFRTQLRALLRASVFGNLCIMFPMIATLEEFRKAKAMLLEEKTKLLEQKVAVADIEVGMMVEIPAAAILADQFAKEVDFFSIGTNDLIQYTMAADRMNERVSYLYQPYNPSILRMISHVIEASHKEGKWTGMCGEMAGEMNAIPLLLALGLDEFSMSATSILQTRSILKKLSYEQTTSLKETILSMSTANEVLEFVKQTFVF